MKRLLFLCSLLAAIYFVSCGDNSTGSSSSGPLFGVKVVDTAGSAAAGLSLGSLNHSDYLPKPSPAPMTCPATIIEFELPIAGYLTIRILNYYGNQVRLLVDSQQTPGGAYSVTWDGHDDDGNPVISGFYQYRVSIWNDDTVSWSLEKWMVVEFALEPAHWFIGSTDSNGVFITDDTLLFPCLLGAPPPIIRTDESGQVIDTIYDFYNDTVTITLSDPEEPDKLMYFERALKVEPNYFEFIWHPVQDQ